MQREPFAYWLVNKPVGVISTVHDPQGRPTVVELVPEPERRVRLFPVGRLDRETEGLVLLTNDGALAHVLLHPSHESEREYRVSVEGRISAATLRELAAGIELEDGITAPARTGRPRHDAASGTTRFSLTLIEGRKRQIRRALAALDYPVVRLVRVRMGPLRAGAPRAGRRASAHRCRAPRAAAPARRANPLRRARGVRRGAMAARPQPVVCSSAATSWRSISTSGSNSRRLLSLRPARL